MKPILRDLLQILWKLLVVYGYLAAALWAVTAVWITALKEIRCPPEFAPLIFPVFLLFYGACGWAATGVWCEWVTKKDTNENTEPGAPGRSKE